MVGAGASEQRERELKFDVPQGWVLPDLGGLVRGATVRVSAEEVESTYFDTDARALFDHRLTLRRRTGSIDEGWQLKVPEAGARTELRLPVGGVAVPREMQRLTQGVRGGAALRPIAVLRTRRELHVINAADQTPLAEFAVDDVSASTMGPSTTISRWREVEIELKSGDEALLQRAAKWLRKSGATTSASSSKLARALDAAPVPPQTSAEPLQGAVLTYLAAQYDAIITGDLRLRRGKDAVHRTRVATRRYRSVLRVFGGYFDGERAAALDAELQWYAGVLGEVRDLQVLRTRLDADLAELPVELVLGPVAARLAETFGAEIAEASRRLDAAMRSKRYLKMLDELRRWRTEPPIIDGAGTRKQLTRLLTKAERKYTKRLAAARRVDADPAARNAAMHSARKAAKRARYTAEVGIPLLGKQARRARKRAKAVQSRLGVRQDAIVASGFLRRVGAVAGTTPGENGFTYGLLLGREFEHGHVHDDG